MKEKVTLRISGEMVSQTMLREQMKNEEWDNKSVILENKTCHIGKTEKKENCIYNMYVPLLVFSRKRTLTLQPTSIKLVQAILYHHHQISQPFKHSMYMNMGTTCWGHKL
jgi:23S rRNA C2498 (ribose-2'-O)-methylase RlmM